MLNQSVLTYIQTHIDSRGIPNISNSDWKQFIQLYSKEDIRDTLAEYITNNNIPFPSRVITKNELIDLFLQFRNTSMMGEYKDFDVVLEKVDYKYKYEDNPLGVIDKSHVYNSVSNYFQQENRMKCGSNQVSSPWDIWHNTEELKKMNWQFWRLGVIANRDINDSMFREGFRIGTYTATQFKPSVAKALYEKHDAINVLDTSCGWGDRLAGFYGTRCTEKYVGCDPNPEVYEVYKQQCIEYEKLLGNTSTLTEYENYFTCVGSKTVLIYNLPSEDVDWSKHQNEFDFYFTSPPYYETERYASNNSDTQSYSRYPSFDSWKNDFFFKVNRMIWDTLRDDAYMMINIIEPRIAKGTRLNLCDDMVDDILTYPKANYLGKIGMRLQVRPHNIVDDSKNGVFIEPVWVFRKNNNQYVRNILMDLFSFD